MNSSLRRSMTLAHATAMVAGIIIGASIFLQPSEITRLVPSARGLILVWLGAGALTLLGALVCAELAAVFPSTGGVYVFFRQIFSPALGFLWGWGMFWVMHSGIIAAIAVILARYAGYFVPLSEWGTRAVAMAAILGLSWINYFGVRTGSAVQVALTTAKIAAVVVISGALLVFGRAAHAATSVQSPAHAAGLVEYSLAIGAGLFAFGGWHMVTYAAGETQDPERTIPRALVLGTLLVTLCYMLLNAGYVYVMPLGEVARSQRVAADAMARVLGAGSGGAIAVVVIVSALGALNGIILAGPRVYYAMAQDRLAFRWMASVHPAKQTPHLAIAAQAAWSCVLVASNSYRTLFSRVVYTEWLFFALLSAGLVLLARRGQARPRYLGFAFPLLPLLFVAASLAIAINQIKADPRGSIVGLGLLLLGLPVYFVWRLLQSKPEKASANATH
jgi:basic amino acid/polyamine antiporter, APA family